MADFLPEQMPQKLPPFGLIEDAVLVVGMVEGRLVIDFRTALP